MIPLFMDAINAIDYSPVENGLQSTLHSLGTSLSFPMWKATEVSIPAFCTFIEYDELSELVTELAKRVVLVALSVLTAPITLTLHLVGQGFRYLAGAEPALYLAGTAPENHPKDQHTWYTHNTCMFPGGLPGPFGGLSPASERIPQLAQDIRASKPDTICLQEMSSEAAYELYDQLKGDYRHFYIDIGPNPPYMSNCLFFATNEKMVSPPVYISLEVPGMQGGMRRGAFFVETRDYWVCTTHLDPHDEDVRKDQLGMIVDHMKTLNKPCLLMGDLNIDRTGKADDEYSTRIPHQFYDPYFHQYPKLNEQSATCTDELTDLYFGKDDPKANYVIKDYVLGFKSKPDTKFKVTRISGFEISDHAALLLTTTKGNDHDNRD